LFNLVCEVSMYRFEFVEFYSPFSCPDSDKHIHIKYVIFLYRFIRDRLCGPGYRSRGPGFDSQR
jgi:hypothetical protein